MDPSLDWIKFLLSDFEEATSEELTSNNGASSSTGNNNKLPMTMISPPDREHMFEKVVTPSDVGKLNRLLIPKKDAERYFPLDSSNNQNGTLLNFQDRNGTLLNFQDRNGKMWRFRYSYWKTRKRYMMTKGWSSFVKEKKLEAGDIVSFQRGIGDESARSKLYIDWSHRRHDTSLVQSPFCSSFSSNFNFPTTSEYSISFDPFLEYTSAQNFNSFQFHPLSEYTSSQNFNSFRPLSEYTSSLSEHSSVPVLGHSGGKAFSGESGSVSTITTVAGTSNPNFDDNSFSIFLSTRGLTLSGCTATDIIDFLSARQHLSDSNALFGRLRAAYEEGFGIKPKSKDNPFCSLAVVSYLRKNSWKEECISVFSCNDNVDVEETSFINEIVTELDKREVTPLRYNLSWIEKLDAEMVYRCSVGIVVLSNSFALTSQSLDHLVAIMEHCKAKDLVVIPVYFRVTPSDILEGQFEAAQLRYRDSVQADIVKKWKAAITELASIDGHQWTDGTQFIIAKEVVRDACLRLLLKNSDNVVRILALLDHPKPSSDAEIEGIWGMAGIGKTSIAREIFEILAPRYDLCYFLQDFHRICQSKGLRQVRDDFFSKLFGEEKLSIGACDTKSSFMRDWFHNKAILVVLDDVTNARDAEYVVGGFDWFSHGHKIILTSRRKQVLVQCKVKKPFKIRKLDDFDSFHLGKQYLEEESAVISELMSCSSGIPLALEVLGSSVSKQHINNMMEHLHNLRRNPPTQIQEAFRRSFDGLDENKKNIFLDLACFFRGEDKDDVVQLLDACGFLTYLGICDLIDESLISLVDNRIVIPIPFQDMGRFVVREEDEVPCERSRLWDSGDVADILINNSGTEAIEGIFMDASDLTCELSPTVFGKMYNLRLLKFYCSTSGNQCKLSLPEGLDTFPDELRLLHWENYPLKYLPQKFNPENLVELNMPYSNMEKLWEGKKNLGKLKKIQLSHSRNLKDILMLSEALNLEHIDLEGCTSLVDIRTCIPRCGKLVSLNMKDCSHLRSLSSMVDLTSLKFLNLSGCSQLEEIQDFAPNLKELYLARTPIRELPLSIENLTNLSTLDLQNCRRLRQLPFGIKNSKSIVKLKLSGCTSLVHTSTGASVNSSPLPLLSPFPNWKRKR